MKIIWSPLAIDRVVDIGMWIGVRSPDAAERITDAIFAATDRLELFPESGREVPEIGRWEIREVIFEQYRIIYRVGEVSVDILTVRHSLQLLQEEDLDEFK